MPAAKQTVETPKTEDPFELTPEHLREWYLGPFQKMDAHLRKIRKSLIEDKGVSSELATRYTSREKTPLENRYEEVLKLSVNKNNNQFFSLKGLLERGDISQEQADAIKSNPEYQGYNNGEPPFFYISAITRVFSRHDPTNKKSWLVANILFEGLTAKGERINKASRIGFHAIPRPSSNNSIQDPKTKEMVELPVYPVQQLDPFSESNRVYDLAFSKETFDAMLKHALPQCSLKVSREGGGKYFVTRNIDEFLTDDVDSLIKDYTTPKPTNEYNFNIDPKDLADFMKFQKAKEEQGENHFQ